MLLLMNEGNIDDRQLKKRKSAASLVHNWLSNEHKFSIYAHDDVNWIHMVAQTAVIMICWIINVTDNINDITRFLSSFYCWWYSVWVIVFSFFSITPRRIYLYRQIIQRKGKNSYCLDKKRQGWLRLMTSSIVYPMFISRFSLSALTSTTDCRFFLLSNNWLNDRRIRIVFNTW
jgi:hypothetical protein